LDTTCMLMLDMTIFAACLIGLLLKTYFVAAASSYIYVPSNLVP
jgi:hypothetical protein